MKLAREFGFENVWVLNRGGGGGSWTRVRKPFSVGSTCVAAKFESYRLPCRAAGQQTASHLSFGWMSATATNPRLCQMILLSVTRPGPETNRCSISQLSSESETLIVGVYFVCSGFTRWLHLDMHHTASASPSKPRRPLYEGWPL